MYSDTYIGKMRETFRLIHEAQDAYSIYVPMVEIQELKYCHLFFFFLNAYKQCNAVTLFVSLALHACLYTKSFYRVGCSFLSL